MRYTWIASLTRLLGFLTFLSIGGSLLAQIFECFCLNVVIGWTELQRSLIAIVWGFNLCSFFNIVISFLFSLEFSLDLLWVKGFFHFHWGLVLSVLVFQHFLIYQRGDAASLPIVIIKFSVSWGIQTRFLRWDLIMDGNCIVENWNRLLILYILICLSQYIIGIVIGIWIKPNSLWSKW
jgi:hypothetical protein